MFKESNFAGGVLLSIIYLSLGHAHAQAPNPAAKPIIELRIPNPGVATGPSFAHVYDIASGNINLTAVPGDELKLPDIGGYPSDLVISQPVKPAIASYARIEFEGTSYCTGTAVGRRSFLTAGHCVYDKDAGHFKKSAVVYPGYSQEVVPYHFKAIRFVAFSGWINSKDYGHDVALVEIDTDLPSSIVTFDLSADAYACRGVGLFDQHHYAESQDQLFTQGIHRGCRNNQYYWMLGTTSGSSGAAAIARGKIYGVYSNTATGGAGGVGNHAPLTAAKICYLRNGFLGQPCQPPEDVGTTRLRLETTRLDVIQGAAFVDVVVYRTGGSSGEVRIQYDTASDSALAGRDFERTMGTITWLDGDIAPKTVRVPLMTAADLGCERQFGLLLYNKPGDPVLEIEGQPRTTVSILSAGLSLSSRSMVLKQVVTPGVGDVDGGLPVSALMPLPNGQAVFTNTGLTIASFWRDVQHGTLRRQRTVTDPRGGYLSLPSLSPDGLQIVRLADAELQVFARNSSSLAFSKVFALIHDYDRSSGFDIVQSPDARADVYVAGFNSVSKHAVILRYQHDTVSGVLSDKRIVRGGDGTIPDYKGIHALGVTKDGRFLLAVASAPNALLAFQRNVDGTLLFIEQHSAPFEAFQPNALLLDQNGKWAYVLAATPDGRTKMFPFSISSAGNLGALPAIDVPVTPGSDAALSPDGKELFIISGKKKPWVYRFSITNGSVNADAEYDPQRCMTKADLDFALSSIAVSPDGRSVILGQPEQALVVLQKEN